MKKFIFTLIFVQSFFIYCGHQTKKFFVPEQSREIFFRDNKSTSHYRKSIDPITSPSYTSIVAVGDIFIGGHATYYLDKYGAQYPFDSTKIILSNGHFTIGNLEAPFATTGSKFDKKFNFKVPPRFATGLLEAGFDVVNLANNHIMDYGQEALVSTLNTLDSTGISHCGAGLNLKQARQPAILQFKGVKVAFIGCSLTFPEEFWATNHRAGTFYPNEKDLIESISRAERLADFTVVTFHWGEELRNTPKDYQMYFAHLSIDAGADLILGHHPHVLQGLEIYHNRLIIYSLGNFAFASYSNKSKESIILKTFLTQDGLLYARVIPISVYNVEVNFQPRILRSEAADAVITYLNRLSLALNCNREIINHNGMIWGDWALHSDELALKVD